MATTPDVLTVGEVAAFMRVSRETVYRLATRGELPGRKIGRIWRFTRKAIENYLCEYEGTEDGNRPNGGIALKGTEI